MLHLRSCTSYTTMQGLLTDKVDFACLLYKQRLEIRIVNE